MKRKLLKIYPLVVALLVCGFLGWMYERDAKLPVSPSLFQRFEWYLHDWRVQHAYRHPAPSAATNLAVVEINNRSRRTMRETFPDIGGRWPFHHFHYGPMLDELKAQGALAIGFDILILEQDDRIAYRVPHLTGTTNAVLSRDYFADRLRASGNVILATAAEQIGGPLVPPLPQYHTNAQGIGLVEGRADRDGVLRRVIAFKDDAVLGRVWSLGFELAARSLGANLKQAVVTEGLIRLPCPNGAVREVPLGPENTFLLDWVARPGHPNPAQRVRQLDFGKVFSDASKRGFGVQVEDWGIRNSLVVIGASGAGVNSVDRAPSALNKADSIFLAHVNVANSLLTGRFVQRLPAAQELGIIFGLALVATWVGWRIPTPWASLTVLLAAGAYAAVAVWAYTAHRYLLPMALPLLGALVTTHLVMTVCRGVENAQRRELERLLRRVVSPKTLRALLALDSPAPPTRRLEVTVLFAELRGFTRFAEESTARAEAAARALELQPEKVRALADEAAREAVNAVNRYLAVVVDEIKATDGTLDKCAGESVVAFWGAPVSDADQAMNAIRCAAATQQAVELINHEHAAQNEYRERVNAQREALKEPPMPLLPVLRLGVGLNTGAATVGFMGSENHLSNYTVFGQVVNVASHLLGLLSGGGIILTEQTLRAAARNDAIIATKSIERPAVLLKGCPAPVKVYELRWKPATGEANGTR